MSSNGKCMHATFSNVKMLSNSNLMQVILSPRFGLVRPGPNYWPSWTGPRSICGWTVLSLLSYSTHDTALAESRTHNLPTASLTSKPLHHLAEKVSKCKVTDYKLVAYLWLRSGQCVTGDVCQRRWWHHRSRLTSPAVAACSCRCSANSLQRAQRKEDSDWEKLYEHREYWN